MHVDGYIHERYIYSMFDLLGDLGGVIDVLMWFFGFFFYPIAQHAFILKAIKKLYIARTAQGELF